MGQRSQTYIVIKKDNQYKALSAHHHQWCYGLTAASDLARLAIMAKRALTSTDGKWHEYALRDPLRCDTLVQAVYGVDIEAGTVSRVHNESDCLIKEGTALPERGDNNDGAALLIIDHDLKQVRACLFTPGHIEGEFGAKAKPWTPWTPREYFDFYYQGERAEGMLESNPLRARALEHAAHYLVPVTKQELGLVFSQSVPKTKRKSKDKELRIV